MHVSRRADDFVGAQLLAEAVAQPALHQIDCKVGDVDADPAPLQAFGDGDGSSAAAEGIFCGVVRYVALVHGRSRHS